MPFIILSGKSYGSDRVHISVDKSKAADGVRNATVTVEQKIGDNVVDTKQIAVTIENPTEQISEKTYVEAGGVVSIEAEHYTDKCGSRSKTDAWSRRIVQQ